MVINGMTYLEIPPFYYIFYYIYYICPYPGVKQVAFMVGLFTYTKVMVTCRWPVTVT